MEEKSDKYVKLAHVEELIKLVKQRDAFHDWSDSYEKYDKKVKRTIDWMRENARPL